MSPQVARALAMAYELRKLLEDLYNLPDHGQGSCVEGARDHMDYVIGMLEDDVGVPPVTRLRLVKG